jgi:WD40 repeat protein
MEVVDESASASPTEQGARPVPPAPSPEPAGGWPTVAGYAILGELGRGGMGVVYKARQLSLKRLVALKMVLAGPHAGPADLVRLRTEAEAVARLQHPNIVQIYEVGQQDGRPFLSLEFVDGGSLARALTGTPLPARRAAQLVETLARAVHAAHQRDIIHRDLKPGNVLLTSDGQPKITDFGLAKQLDAGTGQTQSGAIMGTPSYMAPEQAGGKSKDIGPAADTYALGAILYELLTGRPPFMAETTIDTVFLVITQEPVPPRQLQPKVPLDLDTICLKCLEKEPRKRYASAAALADDLGRFLDGEPISARPISYWGRTLKWIQRRPAVAGMLALLLLIAGAAFALVTWKWQDAEAARREANAETAAAIRAKQATGDALKLVKEKEQLAQAARDRAEASVYFNHLTQADLEWRNKNAVRAEQILDECRLDLRRWEWHYLKRLVQGGKVISLPQPAAALGVAFGPGGRRLACAGADQTIRIWDLARGKVVRTLSGHAGAITAVAFSPDGKWLASASADQTLKLWDPDAGTELRTFRGHSDIVTCLAFRPDGRRLVSGSRDFTVMVWDTTTAKELHTLGPGGHADRITAVAFSPDGKRIASASDDRTAKVWDAEGGKAPLTFREHQREVEAVAFSPDNRHVASVGQDGKVKLWDAATGEVVFSLRGSRGFLTFSPDGQRLAAAAGGIIRLLDAGAGQEALALPGPAGGRVQSLAFSPDGLRLAASWNGLAGPGEVRVWDATPTPEAFTLHGPSGSVAGLAFSPDGKLLASAGLGLALSPGEVQVWDTATAGEVRTLEGHLQGVTSVAFSPDGKLLATGSADRILMVWDVPTFKDPHRLVEEQGHTGIVRGIAFSPDGKQVVSAAADRTLKLWDVAGRKLVRTFTGHAAAVNSVAFQPAGKYFASAGDDRTVKLWEAATTREVHTFREPRRSVHAVAFSPDGNTLAAAGKDQRVYVWDVAGRQILHTLKGHANPILAVAFSPDSRFLASAGVDLVLRVWEVRTGKLLVAQKGHTAAITSLAYSPGGKYLASAGVDGIIKVWDVKRWPLPKTFRP